ncbi:MAG TPA: SBBP repeat-containing protein, partial [Bryobacteraceae bacterium]|nr:SBBP repeat-containing protein [Bryobacteraceae bacterium]
IDSASAIAVDGNGNAYILGTTNSLNFPVTPGVLVPAIAPQASAGFLVKISPGAALSYATYLGPMSGKAIIVDTSGQATIAGMGQAPGLPPPPPRTSPQALVKLDAAAAHVLEEIYIPGASGSDSGMALAVDRQGNPIVSGQAEAASFQATSGAYVSPEPVTGCNTGGNLFHSTGMGAYVMKLRAADWQPLYAALITAPCGARPGSMAVDAAGSVILGLVSGQGLPLKTPLLAGPDCSYHSSAIAKLSPDGSGIEFATYLDGCGIPAIALGKNGSLYAGVSPTATNRSMGVLRLPAASSPGISLNGISNAFSGDATAVVAGGLYSIAISGVQTQAVNPGLEPAQNLPTQLGGVRVNFDGAPAPILAVEPGRVIVAAPPGVIHEQGGRDGEASSRPAYGPAFTSVQVFYNDAPSNAVWMPVSDYWPGLLTHDFFNPAVPPDSADGYVLNEDGAWNDAAHPAAPGSTISVFATGVGAADPPVDPGAIADSHGAAPAHAIYSSWQRGSLGGIPPGETASTSPGFISAVFQITVEVPDSIASLGGTDAGNEVRRVPLALVPRAPGPYPDPPLSNQVGVYLK